MFSNDNCTSTINRYDYSLSKYHPDSLHNSDNVATIPYPKCKNSGELHNKQKKEVSKSHTETLSYVTNSSNTILPVINDHSYCITTVDKQIKNTFSPDTLTAVLRPTPCNKLFESKLISFNNFNINEEEWGILSKKINQVAGKIAASKV